MEEVAWKTAVDAAPWLLGGEPEEAVPPDELYERATVAGTAITHELQDEDYGSRGFTCRDAEGVYWSFGTYAGAVS